MRKLLLIVAASAAALAAMGATESPYVGQDERDIKALSPQQIEGFLDGRGMGYAKAAELNAFPGPKHVLDLAEELALSEAQRQQTRALYERMKSKAASLGRRLVAKEKELDARFADGSISAASLDALVTEIGALEARIRRVHLEAHLAQKALLDKHQVHQYVRLRGYGSAGGSGHNHGH